LTERAFALSVSKSICPFSHFQKCITIAFSYFEVPHFPFFHQITIFHNTYVHFCNPANTTPSTIHTLSLNLLQKSMTENRENNHFSYFKLFINPISKVFQLFTDSHLIDVIKETKQNKTKQNKNKNKRINE